MLGPDEKSVWSPETSLLLPLTSAGLVKKTRSLLANLVPLRFR